ncbi:hypothetical protein R3P38DRAFT_3108976 [Favolaschia claudopus]|uniref:Uncharacterized protein n=1 Tax=Favolaschia claudopus TaxID=2862362 RepID=A0AAV9ZI35_9AGAR
MSNDSMDPALRAVCREVTRGLEEIRHRVSQRAMLLALHVDNPSYTPPPRILPHDFPETTLPINVTLRPIPELPTQHQHQVQRVCLKYQPSTPANSPRAWLIYWGNVVLGSFEVSSPTFLVNADLVLAALTASINAQRKASLVSIFSQSPASESESDLGQLEAPTILESMWVTTDSQTGRLVMQRELGQCLHEGRESRCETLLPHPGPRFCVIHAL